MNPDDNTFDEWNQIKKKIHAEASDKLDNFPKEREIWMCVLGKNIGYEQNGIGESFSRPVLVIKKFNNQMFWAVPLSTRQKDFDFYYNFTDPLGEKVSAILAQFRLFSVKRFGRKLYELPESEYFAITSRLREFIPSR